ncbi:MAG: hypothetical protein LLG40_09980 [Deltaproteobacteria bacterium]|nr:hypothetical protein [Deltaproteobacteria bacterium]
MSGDRVEAIKEFVSFLERKKDVNVSGDLYVGNVNFLLTENAELRATIAEKDKEIIRLNNFIAGMVRKAADKHLDGYRELSMMACKQEERAEKAEAELAELRERMKPVEEVYKEFNTLENEKDGFDEECKDVFWQAIKTACENE